MLACVTPSSLFCEIWKVWNIKNRRPHQSRKALNILGLKMYARNSVEVNNKGRFVSWVNDRLVLFACVVLSIHPKIKKNEVQWSERPDACWKCPQRIRLLATNDIPIWRPWTKPLGSKCFVGFILWWQRCCFLMCSMCMYKLNQAICSRCRHETFVARLDLSIIYKIGLYVNCYRRKRDIIHMLCMENSFKFQKCVSAMSFAHFVGSASDPMFLHPLDGISAT